MDIRFECPRCRQHLAVDGSAAGMEVNCPTCKSPVTIPAAPSATVKPGRRLTPAVPPPTEAFAPAPPLTTRSEKLRPPLPLPWLSPDSPPAPERGPEPLVQACHACGLMVAKERESCPHCGARRRPAGPEAIASPAAATIPATPAAEMTGDMVVVVALWGIVVAAVVFVVVLVTGVWPGGGPTSSAAPAAAPSAPPSQPVASPAPPSNPVAPPAPPSPPRERYYRDGKGALVSESDAESQMSEIRRNIRAMPDDGEKAFAQGMLKVLEKEWSRIKSEGPVGER